MKSYGGKKMKARKIIGIDKAKGDSIEIITRYRDDEVVYSVDGGKSYHETSRLAIRAYERELAKQKIDKAVQIYCENLMPLIAEARNKVVRAGASPKVMYIGDIFQYKKNELPESPMKLNTGCKVFGMKIIADYRVPIDKFYIMQGEL